MSNKKESKEFFRNVCFTFFESYLEGAEKMAEAQGKEFAFDYLTGIIRYALYEEESEDFMINAMVSALKNTIDANQSKRATGFTGENKEQTEAILKYYQEHPEASEREVADAVGCGKTKVNKVKRKYLNSSNDICNANNSSNVNFNHNFNNNFNINTNNNSNSYLNINSETVGETIGASDKTAAAEDKIDVP